MRNSKAKRLKRLAIETIGDSMPWLVYEDRDALPQCTNLQRSRPQLMANNGVLTIRTLGNCIRAVYQDLKKKVK